MFESKPAVHGWELLLYLNSQNVFFLVEKTPHTEVRVQYFAKGQLEEPGIEQTTFWLVDNPLHFLSHSTQYALSPTRDTSMTFVTTNYSLTKPWDRWES